jgi:EmrB/QacA subfamily drug resistance transporter
MNGGTKTAATTAAAGAGLILFTLATGQFVMTLDTSVMNVSIATVAKDLGTTVTGIQTAITLYTLVMASLMITGGKIGQIIGRKRAFSIGAVIYGIGSLITALSPTLGVLLIGWSLLEGLGACLIMPAIVALVASNFEQSERPRAYGLIASASAIAVAVGPLIGGLVTTAFSWRWVFAGEDVIIIGLLIFSRGIKDAPPEGTRPRIDVVGVLLSASGLALLVFGVLRSGEWGWIQPKTSTMWFGLSPVIVLMCTGALLLWAFFSWERHLIARDREPLTDPAMLKNTQMRSGLVTFFFQYLLQMGLFFIIPLFLSVVLGLSAFDTGVRLLPLSITLLVAAVGIPRFRPNANPRRVARVGLLALFAGIVTLLLGLNEGAGAEITTVPLLIAGLGVGALASQLGSVCVSAVPDEQSAEVGGLQNTFTNLGASVGTALAGSVLIAALTTTFLTGVSNDPKVSQQVSDKANVELASGVPFVSDADLQTALDNAGVPEDEAQAIVDDNADARIQALRASLGVLALIAILALFFTGGIPTVQPGAKEEEKARA